MDEDGDFDIAFSNREKTQTTEKETYNPNQLQNQLNVKPSTDQVIQTPKKQEMFSIGASDFAISKASHPKACIATIGFKIFALVVYLCGDLVAPVPFFIMGTIFSALDFWVVKNVTGRLLVGLRWWSGYDEKGNQVWKFESPNSEVKKNSVDKTFFWVSQLGATLLWAILSLFNIIGFDPFWLMLDFLNLVLCGTNLYGFYKCSGDHSKKIKNLQNQGFKQIAGKLF